MKWKTTYKRTFTWSEFVETARKQGNPPGGCDDTWAGGSFTNSLKMGSETGFQQALPEAEALANGITETVAAQVSMETFQAAYDVAGSEVDISRFMAGTPECMIEAQPIKIARAGRAVRILVPVSVVNHIDEEVVRRRGAAVMALVYVLQQLRHPLEVWAGIAALNTDSRGENRQRFAYAICVQRADEPLDAARLMYALAHPTVFRRLGFSVMASEDETFKRRYGIGHSYGCEVFAAEADDLPKEDAGNTIVLPELKRGSSWDVESSVDWIEEQLQLIFENS